MQSALDIQSHIDSLQAEIVRLKGVIATLEATVSEGHEKLAAAHQVSEDLAERTKAAFDKGDERELHALITESLAHGNNRKRTRMQNEAASLAEKAKALLAESEALLKEVESIA